MSVGGKVIEVIYIYEKDNLWINTCDRRGCPESCSTKGHNECAVYCEPPKIGIIRPGDSLWWQGDWCLWTRKDSQGKRFDEIALKKVGYSGVRRPLKIS